MRRLLTTLAVLALASNVSAGTVTLLHFSDYHSHAVPFYTSDGMRGGIARAIGHLSKEKRRGALVFNGGDMMNASAPAWSDRYGCTEWAWLNGIVDAMAYGNHDADYGREQFDRCRSDITYPILSANTAGFDEYRVFNAGGARIGVFAIAGSDFPQLVKTPGFSFADPVSAARDAVRALREKEHVDAVVMIGHEHAEADYALAKEVPGIDLIFGTHSHLERALTQIPGTSTWFISPSQYLAFISRVELTIDGGRVSAVRGALVPVDESMPESRPIARRVRRMQRRLERDRKYRALFQAVGRLDAALPVRDLAQRTLNAMRAATHADVALSTVSSFRLPLPAGTLTMETLRGAMPYDNEIVVCSMSGAEVQKLLDESAARAGSDSESFIAAPEPIEMGRTYRVATTDYLANVAYRDVFSCAKEKSGLRVRDELRKTLAR